MRWTSTVQYYSGMHRRVSKVIEVISVIRQEINDLIQSDPSSEWLPSLISVSLDSWYSCDEIKVTLFSEAEEYLCKIAAGFQQQDIDLLARCKTTVRNRIARVRRPENRSSWSSHAGERNLDRRLKKADRGRGRDWSFSGPAIVLGRSESRSSALDQPRVRASGAT